LREASRIINLTGRLYGNQEGPVRMETVRLPIGGGLAQDGIGLHENENWLDGRRTRKILGGVTKDASPP